MPTQSEKAEIFKSLHEARDAFFIPNPWDGGSAVALEKAGFKALATTSAIGSARWYGSRASSGVGCAAAGSSAR